MKKKIFSDLPSLPKKSLPDVFAALVDLSATFKGVRIEGKEAIREKRINLLMLLCVSGKGSHLVSVVHNSHTEHIHIHIFQYFLSFP